MIIETWYSISGYRNITEWVQAFASPFAHNYNLKNIQDELEAAIQDEMPEGYSFHNLAFHKDDDAPAPLIYLDNKGDLDLYQLIENVDYWPIFDTNRKDAPHVGAIAPNILI